VLKNKNALALTVVVSAAALAMSACSSSSPSKTNAGSAATTAAASSAASGGAGSTATYDAKGAKVTFIQGVAGDPFYETMACGAKAEAKKDNVSLNVQGDTTWDVSLQSPLVNTVVQSKPKVLFIAPNDSKGMIAPLKAATEAGVKIGLVDTTLTDTSFSSFDIATNNLAAGADAADALAKLIGDKGSVLIAGLTPGVSTSQDRGNGFITEMKKFPNIKYIGSVFTNTGGVSGIAALVGAKIAATPDLAGVFALAGDQSEGTANAIRAAGKVGKVQVVGFDAGPSQVQQLKQGIVQALVAQEPAEIGRMAVDDSAALITGQPVTKMAGAPSAVITAKNVDDPSMAQYLYTTTCSA
jgi:ribose transport system substrate-binding protein